MVRESARGFSYAAGPFHPGGLAALAPIPAFPPVSLSCSSRSSGMLLCLWRVPLLWCVPPVSLLCLPRVRGCLETAANRTTERKQATSCETTVERGSAVGFRYWNLNAVRARKRKIKRGTRKCTRVPLCRRALSSWRPGGLGSYTLSLIHI